MLTGDNGLLNQTGNASKVTGVAQIKEAIDLAVMSVFALDPLGDLTTENLETIFAQNMPTGTDYEFSGDETESLNAIYQRLKDGRKLKLPVKCLLVYNSWYEIKKNFKHWIFL